MAPRTVDYDHVKQQTCTALRPTEGGGDERTVPTMSTLVARCATSRRQRLLVGLDNRQQATIRHREPVKQQGALRRSMENDDRNGSAENRRAASASQSMHLPALLRARGLPRMPSPDSPRDGSVYRATRSPSCRMHRQAREPLPGGIARRKRHSLDVP